MTGLIICGHGDFAAGMYSSLKLLNGECEHLVCISFQEGTSFEDLCDTVNKEVERFIDGNVIILTDLPGGSPFKAAAMATFLFCWIWFYQGIMQRMWISCLIKVLITQGKR